MRGEQEVKSWSSWPQTRCGKRGRKGWKQNPIPVFSGGAGYNQKLSISQRILREKWVMGLEKGRHSLHVCFIFTKLWKGSEKREIL